MDEIKFMMRVSGYVWTPVAIKLSKSSDFDDRDVKIKDIYGN
jgi:hypothetical protein